jgi:hypothetical protein
MLVMFFYTHEYAKIRYIFINLAFYILFTSSSSFKFCLPIELGTPAVRLATEIPYTKVLTMEILFTYFTISRPNGTAFASGISGALSIAL